MNRILHIIAGMALCASMLSADYRWERATPMNISRTGHTGVAHEDRIYVFGGVNRDRRQILSSVEVYNPERRNWREIEPLPVPLYQASAVSYGRNILIFGGQTPDGLNNRIFLYNPQLDTFIVVSRMPGSSRHGLAAIRIGRRILVMGGYSSADKMEGSGWWFNPDSLEWSEAPQFDTPCANFGMVENNGMAWVVGGFNIGGPMDRLEVFRDEEWIERTPMPTARGGLGAAFLGDALFVAGGRVIRGPGAITGLVEGYLPAENEWSEARFPPLIDPRMDFVMVELNDTLYAIGGRRDMGMSALNTVEIFYYFENSVDDRQVPEWSKGLLQFMPNPTNGSVTWLFPTIDARLMIADTQGHLIVDRMFGREVNVWIWNSSAYPAGTYLYKFAAVDGSSVQSGRILVIK